MNEFRQKLEDKIKAFRVSTRADKVAVFRLYQLVYPNDYKLQYNNGELELHKVILPGFKDKHYSWEPVYGFVDTTKPEDFIYETKTFAGG